MTAKVKPDNTERNRRIVEMYKDGLSFDAIAAQLGISRNVVAGATRRAGIATRGGKRIPYINVIGQRFNRLVVLRRDLPDRRGRVILICLCDCGQTKAIESNHVRAGRTKSCGCIGLAHPKIGHIWRKRALAA